MSPPLLSWSVSSQRFSKNLSRSPPVFNREFDHIEVRAGSGVPHEARRYHIAIVIPP
jgi:hypothetical protein